LVEEKSLTLIDIAMPNNEADILKAAHEIGKPITRIVLTHAHGDHIGALDALKKQLPDAIPSIFPLGIPACLMVIARLKRMSQPHLFVAACQSQA
jgi:glyoxylase-like metal-dependent hydrolase (beta-lactamase superfamily II)